MIRPRFAPRLFLLVLAAALAAPAAARADANRQFARWFTTCWSKDGSCAADAVLVGAEAGGNHKLILSLARSKGEEAGWRISLRLNQVRIDADSALVFQAEGGPQLVFEPGTGVDYSRAGQKAEIRRGDQADKLLLALAAAPYLNVEFHNGGEELIHARWNLSGIADAMAWMDDVQGRGAPETTGSLATPGALIGADAIPEPVLQRHFAASSCDREGGKPVSAAGAKAIPLTRGKTLYAVPCYAGAYNIAYRLYLARQGEEARARTLFFANYSKSLGWYGSDTLINPSYDPATKTLSAFGKGRGLGDCGNTARYLWDGFDFKMVEYRNWDQCDGTRNADQWPLIYKPDS